MNKFRLMSVFVILAMLLSFGNVRPALATPPTLTDLGTLGGNFSEASGINEAGQVVGSSYTASGDYHAFLWDGITMNDLGTLGGNSSEGIGINDAGQVVGFSSTASGYSHAFVWDSVGGMTDLGTLGGNDSSARDINEAGQVIGGASTASGDVHAFVWDSVGGMTDLGTFGGNRISVRDINEAGQVIGKAKTASGDFHAFVWDSVGGMTDLGTLGGNSSEAWGINDAGQVVGFSSTASGDVHAFVWDSVGGMTDLGTFGGNYSLAVGINEVGQVIGGAGTASGIRHAFVWDSVGGMIDLGTLGGKHSLALGINEAGQVIGGLIYPGDPEEHAFVWDSVGGMTDLGTFGGNYSEATGINEAGQVVGYASTSGDAAYRAFITGPTSPNQPPTADAGGPYTTGEGSSIQLDAAASFDFNQDRTTLTYEWDLDYDGVNFDINVTGIQPVIGFPDNFPDRMIGVRVTDSGGFTDIDITSLEVTNIAPTATFANISDTIIQGESATLVFSNQFDPSPTDTTAGFLYSYDCTDDGEFEATDVSAASFDCSYATSSNFTVRSLIEDKDGDFTSYTVGVTVLTPQQATESVIDDVQSLVDTGTLNQGQGNALISKLESTIEKLNNGRTNAAINQLQAFINQINDLINTGVLLPAEGQPLIDAANNVINHLQGQTSAAADEFVVIDQDIFLPIIQSD